MDGMHLDHYLRTSDEGFADTCLMEEAKQSEAEQSAVEG